MTDNEDSENDSDEVWDEIEVEPSNLMETSAAASSVEDIEISIEGPKKKAATKYEKLFQLRLHEAHLMCLLGSAIYRNGIASNPDLHASLLSLVPGNLLDLTDDDDDDGNGRAKKKQKKSALPNQLQALLNWFLDSIGIIHFLEDYNFEMTRNKPDILSGISRECACIYFVALARACGYDSRLISSLHTLGRTMSAKSLSRMKDSRFPLDFYADVLIDGDWITIDISNGNVGEDVVLKDAEYVVAIANCQTPPFFSVKDITRKFVARWSTVAKKRDENYWGKVLWLFSDNKDNIRKPHEEKENMALVKAEVGEKMPTTVSGFLNHPLFVLERHLKVNEGIYPKEKKDSVGLFKGELVFPRKLVHSLFTAENWKRKGRQIPPITIPYKTTTSKGKKETVKQWFGEWQTVDWTRPLLLSDGVIPTNDFGNIEIFHQQMVPEGCVHVRGPVTIAKKVAKTLDIEFVQACVDFEHSRGRSFPLFDGIVIHEDNEEALRLGIETLMEELAEKERKKKQTEVLQRWKKLITGLRLRQRLQREYATT